MALILTTPTLTLTAILSPAACQLPASRGNKESASLLQQIIHLAYVQSKRKTPPMQSECCFSSPKIDLYSSPMRDLSQGYQEEDKKEKQEITNPSTSPTTSARPAKVCSSDSFPLDPHSRTLLRVGCSRWQHRSSVCALLDRRNRRDVLISK